ncbi:MAG: hypothetical protein Q9209_002290 [Squamulea sp. 1 TL-2023]
MVGLAKYFHVCYIANGRALESGSPWIDEPPETPAPVFAVRAFKTALFGTPHSNQSQETVIQRSPRAKFLTPKTGNKTHTLRAQRTTPLVSPAKGILLTPGTATARRKTVSFGSLDKSKIPAAGTSPTKSEAEDIVVHPDLAKASSKAQLDISKQHLREQDSSTNATARNVLASDTVKQHEGFPVQLDLGNTTADVTVDLAKPRSQSGQHWKAEYERYQKNSDRELRKVIQHGQNVKSYAEKKDIEATELQGKLKRELAKCAAMETKVSKLATQLANRKKIGTEESGDQDTLINDLSRQTALAVRHKQKAERYRTAIKQQTSSSLGHDYDDEPNNAEDLTSDACSINIPVADDAKSDSELSSLRAELCAFRLKLSIAEEKAAKLEATNAKLTKNFLRVKDEMNNYDARRIRKETRLKERIEVLMAEKNASEAKLRHLMTEHEDLLRRIDEPPVRSPERQLMLESNQDSINSKRGSILPGERRTSRLATIPDRQIKHAINIVPTADSKARNTQQAQKAVSRVPAIDIWTMDSPSETGDMTPPAAEPAINLSSIAVSEATHEALREIDRNSVSDHQSINSLPPDTPRPTLEHLATMDSHLQPDFPPSEPTSAAKRMAVRKNTIASPRPSMVSLASSAGRSRLGELPPDRAAAAKARLAQRKSLKEGRRM